MRDRARSDEAQQLLITRCIVVNSVHTAQLNPFFNVLKIKRMIPDKRLVRIYQF